MNYLSNQKLSKMMLIVIFSTLTGCVSNIKHLGFSIPNEDAAITNSAVTVDQMLIKARNKTKSGNKADTFYLTFRNSNINLTDDHKKQLSIFKKNIHSFFYIDCAPSTDDDYFKAASVAINRCKNIRRYLSNSDFESVIKLSPTLTKNQVRVYQ